MKKVRHDFRRSIFERGLDALETNLTRRLNACRRSKRAIPPDLRDLPVVERSAALRDYVAAWAGNLEAWARGALQEYAELATSNADLIETKSDPVAWAEERLRAFLDPRLGSQFEHARVASVDDLDDFPVGKQWAHANVIAWIADLTSVAEVSFLWTKDSHDPYPDDPCPIDEEQARQWRGPVWLGGNPLVDGRSGTGSEAASTDDQMSREETRSLVAMIHYRLWTAIEDGIRRGRQETDLRIARSGATIARSTTANVSDEGFEPSPDYRTVTLHGRRYNLRSDRQAKIVRLLHEAHLAGNPEVVGSHIMKSIGDPTSRMHHAFRNVEGADRLVIRVRKGIYRLGI